MFPKNYKNLLILILGLLVLASALAGLCQAWERPVCCPQEGCDTLQSINPAAPAKTVDVFLPGPVALTEVAASTLSSILPLSVLNDSPINFYLMALKSHPSIAPPLI